MPARCGNLDGAAAHTLALHLREVAIAQEGARRPCRGAGTGVGQRSCDSSSGSRCITLERGGRPWLRSSKGLYKRSQARHGESTARPDRSSLRQVAHWDNEPLGPHRFRERDRPRHVAQGPIEPQLADECGTFQGRRRQLSNGNEHPQRDREVQARSRLPHSGRCKVHRDTPLRPGKCAREERRSHAVTRLAHCGVGETHDREAGQAA